jgi:hypothetical protein
LERHLGQIGGGTSQGSIPKTETAGAVQKLEIGPAEQIDSRPKGRRFVRDTHRQRDRRRIPDRGNRITGTHLEAATRANLGE